MTLRLVFVFILPACLARALQANPGVKRKGVLRYLSAGVLGLAANPSRDTMLQAPSNQDRRVSARCAAESREQRYEDYSHPRADAREPNRNRRFQYFIAHQRAECARRYARGPGCGCLMCNNTEASKEFNSDEFLNMDDGSEHSGDEEPFEALGVEMLPEQLQNLEEMEREQLFKEIRAWNEQLSSLKSQRAQLQNRGGILENDLAKIGTDKGTCLAALTTGYKPNGCAHRRRLPHRHRHPSSPARHGGV